MAVTRTEGGAGNDEDEGNGDVCVCVYVYLCVDTRVRVCVRVLVRRHTCCADGEQVWQHGNNAAHMAGTCTTGGDQDEWQ